MEGPRVGPYYRGGEQSERRRSPDKKGLLVSRSVAQHTERAVGTERERATVEVG